MPRNVEIKVRLADVDAARAAVVALGARSTGVDAQVDRYYALEGRRRVKLRTCRDGAQLVTYDRPETGGIRPSQYTVEPVRADGACRVPPGPPLVVVRKQREILLLDNVRIHMDDVESLGRFLELEAVVDAGHDESTCHGQVRRIMAALGVTETDCLRASYAELLRPA